VKALNWFGLQARLNEWASHGVLAGPFLLICTARLGSLVYGGRGKEGWRGSERGGRYRIQSRRHRVAQKWCSEEEAKHAACTSRGSLHAPATPQAPSVCSGGAGRHTVLLRDLWRLSSSNFTTEQVKMAVTICTRIG
jgi:hypothetical protein